MAREVFESILLQEGGLWVQVRASNTGIRFFVWSERERDGESRRYGVIVVAMPSDPKLSGETDVPCIYDERVGEARSYVRLTETLELREPRVVTVAAKAATLLPAELNDIGHRIAASELDRQPYWDIERAHQFNT